MITPKIELTVKELVKGIPVKALKMESWIKNL